MDFSIYPRLILAPRLLDVQGFSHPPTIWTPRLLGTVDYYQQEQMLRYWQLL